jgi:hypothetical protein
MFIVIDYYNLMMAVDSALFGAIAAVRARAGDKTQPSKPLLQLRRGRAESPAWFLIQAVEFDPEPLSVTNLRVRDVYASESIVRALLEIMASEKWLDRINADGEDKYYLTAGGRAALAELRDGFRQITASLEPLPPADLVRLEMFLGRVIHSSLAGPNRRATGVWLTPITGPRMRQRQHC